MVQRPITICTAQVTQGDVDSFRDLRVMVFVCGFFGLTSQRNLNGEVSMNVQLSPDAMQFVEGLVASGQFESAEAAVAAGVQLLKSQQQLRVEIQKGIDELDAGQGIDGEIVFTELRERAKKAMKSAEQWPS